MPGLLLLLTGRVAGDEDADLLIRDSETGAVAAAETLSFGLPVPGPLPESSTDQTTGDFDGDGDDDLLMRIDENPDRIHWRVYEVENSTTLLILTDDHAT